MTQDTACVDILPILEIAPRRETVRGFSMPEMTQAFAEDHWRAWEYLRDLDLAKGWEIVKAERRGQL